MEVARRPDRALEDEVDAIVRLVQVVAVSDDLPTTLRGFNRVLPGRRPLQLVAIPDRRLRTAAAAVTPDEHEVEAIRGWRRALTASDTPTPTPTVSGSGLLVPITRRGRILGALRVRASAEDAAPLSPTLLEAVGAGCAEVITKAAFRHDLVQHRRMLAEAQERASITAKARESVERLLARIAAQAADAARSARSRAARKQLHELAELADGGVLELGRTTAALQLLDARARDLPDSLRVLGRRFEEITGIVVQIRLQGAVVPIEPQCHDAIFRIVCELLVNADRCGRALFIWVVAAYSRDELTVTVGDDGVGLSHRDVFGGGSTSVGLARLRPLVEGAGGTLELTNADPHGALIRAAVPTAGASKRATARRGY